MKTKIPLFSLCALGLLGSSAVAFTEVPAGSIISSATWTVSAGPGNNGSPYILQGPVFVSGAGTILDIEPGVIIRGQPPSSSLEAGSLIIRPEAQIRARGTVANPIIFTTAALDAGLVASGGLSGTATGLAQGYTPGTPPTRWVTGNGDNQYLDSDPATSPLLPVNSSGLRNAGMWGGLFIVGDGLTNSGQVVDFAPVGPGAEDDGFGYIEGLSTATPGLAALATYGGGNSEHNGGIIKYVSIRHGGIATTTSRGINALTLCAVGWKTTISFVDVYCSGIDGVKIFGGGVSLDHLNLNYCADDSLVVDEGWQGSIQFAFVLQGYGYGDNGLELRGENKSWNDQSTFGHPNAANPMGDGRIYNATVLMNTQAFATDPINSNTTGSFSNAAYIRAGWAGQIVNSIFQNYSPTVAGQGVRIDGLITTGLGSSENLAAEYGNSARDYFGQGLLQVRNNTVAGFGTNYVAFTNGTMTQSAAGAASGTTSSGVVVGGVNYPATQNATSTGIMIPTPNHTVAGGVNPRVGPNSGAVVNAGNYNSAQSNNYIASPAVFTSYRGAFDRSAPTLWTFGWTALNRRGILAN